MMMGNIDAWFNLADTCEVLGKADESEEARKKFLELEKQGLESPCRILLSVIVI